MKILKDTKIKLLNLAIIYFLRLKFAYLVQLIITYAAKHCYSIRAQKTSQLTCNRKKDE